MSNESSAQLDATIHLISINCGECGGTYAINTRYYKQKKDEGGYWHCPYCQCSYGFVTSHLQELENKLRQEEMRRRTAQIERDRYKNQARAEKAAKTRIKNRVHKGVCPHCNRHFSNLQRHMETKHLGEREHIKNKRDKHDK